MDYKHEYEYDGKLDPNPKRLRLEMQFGTGCNDRKVVKSDVPLDHLGPKTKKVIDDFFEGIP